MHPTVNITGANPAAGFPDRALKPAISLGALGVRWANRDAGAGLLFAHGLAEHGLAYSSPVKRPSYSQPPADLQRPGLVRSARGRQTNKATSPKAPHNAGEGSQVTETERPTESQSAFASLVNLLLQQQGQLVTGGSLSDVGAGVGADVRAKDASANQADHPGAADHNGGNAGGSMPGSSTLPFAASPSQIADALIQSMLGGTSLGPAATGKSQSRFAPGNLQNPTSGDGTNAGELANAGGPFGLAPTLGTSGGSGLKGSGLKAMTDSEKNLAACLGADSRGAGYDAFASSPLGVFNSSGFNSSGFNTCGRALSSGSPLASSPADAGGKATSGLASSGQAANGEPGNLSVTTAAVSGTSAMTMGDLAFAALLTPHVRDTSVQQTVQQTLQPASQTQPQTESPTDALSRVHFPGDGGNTLGKTVGNTVSNTSTGNITGDTNGATGGGGMVLAAADHQSGTNASSGQAWQDSDSQREPESGEGPGKAALQAPLALGSTGSFAQVAAHVPAQITATGSASAANSMRRDTPPAAASSVVRLHDLTVRVSPSDAAPVDLQISQRRGAVQVAVRTADGALQSSLRQSLPNLVQSLDKAGFHTETFLPHNGLADSGSGLNALAQAAAAGSSQNGPGQNHQNRDSNSAQNADQNTSPQEGQGQGGFSGSRRQPQQDPQQPNHRQPAAGPRGHPAPRMVSQDWMTSSLDAATA